MGYPRNHDAKSASNVIPLAGAAPSCNECKFASECIALDENAGPSILGMRVPSRVIHRDTHVFRMGDDFESIYMVRSGAVKTYVLSEEGDQQVTGFYLPGDVFGLDSIDGGHYACSAVALDTSCVCVLGWEPLTDLAGRSATVRRRVFERLSRKVRQEDRLILLLGQRSADERIATFLLELASKQDRLGFSPRTVSLPMSRGEIGSYLTLAVETVSRVLTRLQKKGFIRVDRNRIEILDFEQLYTASATRRAAVPPSHSPGARASR